MSKEELSRQELQKICSQYGIKGNIATKEMVKCINDVAAGKDIPHKYKKQTWFQKHANKINTGISLISLAISTGCLYVLLRK